MPHLSHTHHKTSKRDSPNEIKVKEKQNNLGFELKYHQVNDSSQSNQKTDHLFSHLYIKKQEMTVCKRTCEVNWFWIRTLAGSESHVKAYLTGRNLKEAQPKSM
jgi:hypothetical protein